MLSTLFTIVDTFVFSATILTSVTLTVTGFGILITPISTGIVCGLLLTDKVLYEKIMNKILRESSTNYQLF